MNTIFDIVREGRIPLITFQSHGRRISDLDDTENFSIKGNILDGKISIPVGEPGEGREDFTLVKSAGEVLISRGVLEGKNLRAQWKNQQLQEGKLRVGLEGEDAPLHVEIAIETDLSLLPPLLNRLRKDPGFREGMARFRQLEGRAKGKLVLGEAEGVPVAVLQGRVHFYEGYGMNEVVYPARVLGALGIRQLIVTNAAGGINADFP